MFTWAEEQHVCVQLFDANTGFRGAPPPARAQLRADVRQALGVAGLSWNTRRSAKPYARRYRAGLGWLVVSGFTPLQHIAAESARLFR